MLPGFSGSLVSEYFAETFLHELFGGSLGERTRAAGRSHFLKWCRGPARELGPVTGARGVHDLAAVPVMRTLGFEPAIIAAAADGGFVLSRLDRSRSAPVLLAAPWAEPLDAAWSLATRHVIATGAHWCISTNGRQVRLLDVRRALARGFVEFDLDAAAEDEAVFSVMWGLLRRESFESPPVIERVAAASSRHAAGVCRSLRFGVLEAIGELLSGFAGSTRHADAVGADDLNVLHEQALTVVYRVLFLLFAESRGLVPLWHPVYRESYSIEALRDLAERPGRARGLWESLQALSRLAHAGCRAGTLRVTPFNGRLFAPATTPLAESGRVNDEAARRVLLALSTTSPRHGDGRIRIAYRDLGVEQLGAVYEGVLDYRPSVVRVPESPTPRASTLRTGGRSIRAARAQLRLEPGSGGGKRPGRSTRPGRSRPTWSARSWRHSSLAPLPTRFCRAGSSTPRWEAARFSSQRAAILRARTRRPSSPVEGATPATSPTPTAARSGASSPSGASTAWTGTRSPCSSRDCRCGCAPSRPTAR